MDIKWKSLNSTKLRKITPWGIFISVTVFMLSLGLIPGYDLSFSLFFEIDPLKSPWLLAKFEEGYGRLNELVSAYGSEEDVLEGKFLTEQDIYETAKQLAGEALEKEGYYLNEEGDLPVIFNHNEGEDYRSAPAEFDVMVQGKLVHVTDVFEFIDYFREEAKAIRITRRLEAYRDQIRFLRSENGFVFLLRTDDGDMVTNLDAEIFTDANEYFRNLPAFYISEKNGAESNLANFRPYELFTISLNSGTAYMGAEYPRVEYAAIGFEPDLYGNYLSAFYTYNFFSRIVFVLFFVSGFSALIFGGLAIFFAGRSFYKDEGNGPVEVKTFAPKKFLYADIALFLIFIAAVAAVNGIGDSAGVYDFESFIAAMYDISVWRVIVNIAIAAIASAIILVSYYSIIFAVKSRELSEHLLFIKVLRFFVYWISAFAGRGKLGFSLIMNRNLDALQSGTDRILEGDFTAPIDIRGRGRAAKLAERINRISDGFNIAVENRMKSERMKTELISNVSHDIRTPLTSIVTYVDLLKKNQLTEEERARYLETLESKTARLKTLIDDLFDASKAQSGNISMEIERLDLHYVLEQALGEVEDKLEASNLNFIVNGAKEPLLIMADGGLLWRVIHNLFSNIFKYSMPNSRVYIDAFAGGGRVHLTFKNMSAYELNISADELMERFTRGDRSRASEGSGLGLTIARSLTESMGGEFTLELDGDLFKVSLSFAAV